MRAVCVTTNYIKNTGQKKEGGKEFVKQGKVGCGAICLNKTKGSNIKKQNKNGEKKKEGYAITKKTNKK